MSDKKHRSRVILNDIIQNEFQGRQISLAEKSGISKAMLSHIVKGVREINANHIGQIMPHISKDAGLSLFSAWTEDILGSNQHKKMFGSDGIKPENINDTLRLRMNDKAETILSRMRDRYLEDEDYLNWIIKYGVMCGFLPEVDINKIVPKAIADIEEVEDNIFHLDILAAAAAGDGQDSEFKDQVAVKTEYPESYKGVRVVGDSMDDGSSGAIKDGDIAVIDTEWTGKPFAVKNRIYSWFTDEGVRLKQFVRRKVGRKTEGFLVSANSDHEDIPYHESMVPQGEFVEIAEPIE